MAELLNERYRLGNRIGVGGMATVYEADDIALSRRVAVKLMHPQFSDDRGFVARFEREARAIAGLNHPGIVGVYDVGRAGNQSFIVMERIEGVSVKQLVGDGPLGVEKTIDIGLQIAKALDHAHGAGVVHRDVKSHNIVVSSDGAAKLVDFGIATTSNDDGLATDAGEVLGTVHYVAPERARGEAATPASDIYSLGIVLYEMATGRLPFEGSNLVEIATRQVSSAPELPSALNAQIPATLERTILHAMQKDPADRPPSAAALARELVLGGSIEEQSTRVVAAPPVPDSPRRPPRPVALRPGSKPASESLATGPSSIWPLVLLAFLAFLLVAGLVPLWSAILQGART